MSELLCFKDDETFNYLFFYFWFGLLFCRLLWSGFGELVLVMEHDPGWPMDNLYEQDKTWFLRMIGAKLSRE